MSLHPISLYFFTRMYASLVDGESKILIDFRIENIWLEILIKAINA